MIIIRLKMIFINKWTNKYTHRQKSSTQRKGGIKWQNWEGIYMKKEKYTITAMSFE